MQVKNDFIDGIESDLLVIVVDSEYRKGIKKILDDLENFMYAIYDSHREEMLKNNK